MSNSALLRRKAMALALRPDKTLELAGCLQRLYDCDADQFRTVINKPGLGRRKVYYLLEIGHRIARSRLSTARLRNIGWTKLQIISEHFNRQSAPALLKLAEENTARDLKLLMA